MPYDAAYAPPTADLPPEAHAPFRSAYQKSLPAMLALPQGELLQVNLDVRVAVTTVLGALPKLTALRARVAALPDFDLAAFDALADYTGALAHAFARHAVAVQSDGSLPALGEQATRTRALLVSDMRALIERELLPAAQLRALKGPPGYRNLAFDLFTLVSAFRERWSAIAGKTALTLDELDRTEALADELLVAYSRREKRPAAITTAADLRARAFTLFSHAYDQARRAVRYLHWNEGDHDTIAPSLYTRRNNRRRSNREQPPAPPQTPDTATEPSPA